MLALTILAGCGRELPSPAPFAACLVPAEPPGTVSGGPTAAVTLTDDVEDAGTGDDVGCFDQLVVTANGEVQPDDAWWFSLRGWRFGVWLPDGPGGPAVGDRVTVDASYVSPGFAPTVGWVDLRDEAGDALAYVGVGGELRDLPDPPGLTLSLGDPVAHDSDSCGSWTSYDLRANDATVPYGGLADVDGLVVRNGGIDVQDGPGDCPDWFVAHAAVAASP